MSKISTSLSNDVGRGLPYKEKHAYTRARKIIKNYALPIHQNWKGKGIFSKGETEKSGSL